MDLIKVVDVMNAQRMVLLGPPGCGKGTQAKRIAEKCLIPHISTGEMLREAAARETEVGRQAKGYMHAGKLVPDEIMIALVKERLGQADCRHGFVLDGYPRTVDQARSLDAFLQEHGTGLDIVLSIEVDEQTIIQRLSNRRLCRSCGRDHNLVTQPPRVEGRCDACGGELYQRADDDAKAIAVRLQAYERQTTPLKTYYDGAGMLRKIDGNRGMDEVAREIGSHLGCLES